MALIPCPDCGREISTAAPACPQCGRPNSPVVAAPQMPVVGPEKTLWQGTPSWLLLLGKIIALVVTAIGVPMIVYVILRSMPDDLERRSSVFRVGMVITAILVLWQAAVVLLAYARVRTTKYTLTNQRVMIESGLFDKVVEDIDLRYVEDTTFRQRFIERMLGVGNVTLVSSDKTTPNYVLRGIPDPRSLRELVRTTAYQVSQRQLFTRST